MIKLKIINLWYTFVQLCSAPFEIFIMKYFYINVHRPQSFDLPQGVLFIANHQSRVDPFLIIYSIGFKNFINVLPARFPITAEYMSRPLIKHILTSFGGYNIGANSIERMKKLLYTRDILRRKGSILLFPEGRINKTGKIDCSSFKDGAAILFYENTPIVFVRLTGFSDFSWRTRTGADKRVITYSEVILEGTPEEKLEKMQEFYR